MPGRMDAAQASPVSAWMAVSREQNDRPLVPQSVRYSVIWAGRMAADPAPEREFGVRHWHRA